MNWSKPLSALVLLALAITVVGSLVSLLLSPAVTELRVLAVLAVAALFVAALSVVGSKSDGRSSNPYW